MSREPSDWPSKRVIITAAATGIGLAIAKSFHALGAKVWISDIAADPLEEAKAAMPGCGAMLCDVGKPDQVDAFVEAATKAMGGLDILINNAGIAGPALPLEEITTDQWEQVMAVNVNGQFFAARAAIPHLKAAGGGSIICVSSVAGKYAFALRSPYATSKAAVIALARTLSVELGPHKIRVNAIAPGAVSGDRITRVLTERAKTKGITYPEMEALALRAASLKTMIDPEEIADLILFLCAPTGRAITGQLHSICGGIEYAE